MNGYYIVQINGKKVHLINDNWNEQTNNEQTDIVVRYNIAAYSCNDCYIGVKCTSANLDEQTSDYVYYYNMLQQYKRVMNKGMGVMIIEEEIEGARCGNSRIIIYQPWNTGEYYD